jgi:hypothetical protein
MVAIVSVVGAIITFSFVAPKSKQLVFQLADYLNNKYPKNLEISILDGVLSTNTAEVHNLEFPEEVFGSDVINQIKNDAKVSYLFSVDGNEENRKLPQYEDVKALVFANKDYLFMKDGHSGKSTIYKISEMPNFVINSGLIEEYTTSAKNFFWPFMILVALIFTAVFSVSMFVKYLLASLFSAFIIWVVLVIAKKDEEYDFCFKKALYSMTLPIILGFIFFILGSFMHMYFISAVVLSALIVLANRKA